ncbi:MAG: glycosyltransferase family 4 protein [Gaiellales bacterium]
MGGPPKLLIVATLAETGGAQTFIRSLAEGLSHKYSIEIAAHGPGGALADTSAALGIPFHHVRNLVRDPHPWRDILGVFEIRRLVRRVRPDVVQINSTKAGLLARIALLGCGVPAVFTAHGWAFSGRRGRSGAFAVAVERAMAPLSAALVCVSDWDRTIAIGRGVSSATRLRVIHNGIKAAERPPERGPWPTRPVLVCVARLAPPKDVGLLLKAMARPDLSNWQLRVIGEGPERPALLALRDELGLEDRVALAGERSDVAAQLEAADAFVLPTRWEGLPYSILEAMASGLPVVASEVGGVPELVANGVTGWLVEPGDVTALADAVRALDKAADGARAMGTAGHERVRRQFAVETMVTSYDQLFQSLLNTTTAPSRWSPHALQ